MLHDSVYFGLFFAIAAKKTQKNSAGRNPVSADTAVCLSSLLNHQLYHQSGRISSSCSAIWIALVAAPLRILSATTQMLSPLSTEKSRRILPM